MQHWAQRRQLSHGLLAMLPLRGSRDDSSGFRVWGFGFGLRVWGLGFRV